MLFLVKLNPEYSSKLLLFLLAAKKKAFIVSFRWDTKILTADRTAGSATVCKELLGTVFLSKFGRDYDVRRVTVKVTGTTSRLLRKERLPAVC